MSNPKYFCKDRLPKSKGHEFSKFEDEYAWVVDKVTGEKKYVVVNQINIYDKIQTELENVDFITIRDGLAVVKSQSDKLVDGVYGDFTNLPKSRIEVLSQINDATNYFNALPADERSVFGNDFNSWYAAGGRVAVSKVVVDDKKDGE